jgi:exopolysaccharide production protein ExoZ
VCVFMALPADASANWEIAACAAPVIFCGLAADPIGNQRLRPGLRALGDASYSIYLTHGFLIGPAEKVWSAVFGHRGAMLFILMAIIFCGIVGLLTYRYVEKPLLRALRGTRPGTLQTARA